MADQAALVGDRNLVVIPTTAGPVRIVSLKSIGGAGRSAVLLDGTTTQANISNSYNDFVKSPTGLVNRLFDLPNTPSYRLDISDRIEHGSSWNLAVLAAHALRAASRELVATAHEATRLVWATGSINAVHLSVERVAHISEKLRKSRGLFETAIEAGMDIHVFLPAGTEEDIDDDVAAELRTLRIEPVFVSRVDDLLGKLSLPALPRAATDEPGKTAGWKGNPYRGLEPYLRAHRAIFFGRAKAREEAVEIVRVAQARGRPFLLVHGPSGVGKSSFALAGLAGDLETLLGADTKLHVATITPSGATSPVDAIAAALADLDWQAEGRPDPNGTAAKSVASRPGAGRPGRLLVVDQLEELFANSVSPSERVAFGEMLEKVVRGGSTYVVVTIRSDALGSLDQVPALARLARDERLYRLERPNRREFGEIIASPAALAGCVFPDMRILDDLVEKAMESSDSLPLLQAVLFRLFEQSEIDGRLTARDLERLGGFEGVVERWADEVAEDIVAKGTSETDLDRVLVSLIRIDRDSGHPLARTMVYDPASAEGGILVHLAKGRLVGLSNSSAGPQARLAHEVLITHWERLAGLVRRLAVAVARRDELEGRASIWIERGRDVAELLRGASQLESAEQLRTERLVALNDHTSEFMERSFAYARAQERERRNSRIVRLSAVAAAVAAIIGAVYFYSDNRVKVAELNTATQRSSVIQTLANAKLAQDFLQTGNIQDASALARKNLFIEDTDTVVPQSYNVLYHTRYLASTRNLTIDRRGSTFVTDRLNDGTYVTTTDLNLTIWSPDKGILSERTVHAESPKVASDGSAFFIDIDSKFLRYTAKTKEWSTVRIPLRTYGDDKIDAYAAIDASNIVGCNDNKVYRLRFDQHGASQIVKEASLVAQECRNIYATPGARVFIQSLEGATEYDYDTLKPVGHYEIYGNSSLPPKTIGDMVVFDGSKPQLAIFRNGGSEIVFSSDVILEKLSPSGKYTVHKTGTRSPDPFKGSETVVTETSGEHQRWSFYCICSIVGIDNKDDIIYYRGNSVYSYNFKTNATITLQSFPSEIEQASILPGGEALLAYGRTGPIRYFELTSKRAGIDKISSGDASVKTLAFVGPTRLATASAEGKIDPRNPLRPLTFNILERNGPQYKQIWSLRTKYPEHSRVAKIGEKLLLIAYELSAQTHIAVAEIEKGIVKDEDTRSMPYVEPVTGHVIYEMPEGLKVLAGESLNERLVLPFDRVNITAWSAQSNFVVGTNGNNISMIDLHNVDVVKTVKSDNFPILVCKSPNRVWTIELHLSEKEGVKPVASLWRRQSDLSAATEILNFNSTDEDDPLNIKALVDSARMGHDTNARQFTCSDTGVYWNEPDIDPIVIVEQDAGSSAVLRPSKTHFITADGAVLDASRTGRILFYPPAGTAIAVEIATGNSVTTAVAYNKLRNIVVAGFENGVIKAWDAGNSASPLLEIPTDLTDVRALSINDDGTQIAAAGSNGSSYVWPLPRPRELAELGG